MEHKKQQDRRKFIRSTVLAAVAVPQLFSGHTKAADFILGVTGLEERFDIVVYGATPAGITAAVAAGREGKRVVLVEPLLLAGGMMSGGLSFSDSNQMAREALRGIFEEFHLRVEKHYTDKGITLPYKISVKDNRPWTYEPHVAENIFHELLNEAGVKVVLGETLQRVKRKGTMLQSFRTTSGKTFSGKMFIDASYEGDLMAAAGVKYRVGRESRSEFSEPLAGAVYPKKPVTLDVRDAQGKPLPYISSTQKAPEGQGDKLIMTYSFRFCFSKDPANQVPFTRPEKYDPAAYELVRRYLKAYPDTPRLIDLYQLPGNKLDGNNGIGLQLSIGLVGLNAAYPDGSPRERQAIWNAHTEYCKGLFYFLTTDPAVPEKIRQQMKEIGYAKDEFAKFDHFPPVLYVREARRMEGEYFLTEKDILHDVEKPDSIGIGSFPVDSHDCQRIATEDGFINEGTIFPKRLEPRKIGQPYQVPYRAIVPKAKECGNLLVPVCLSSSHVAFSSVRVEPAWMVLGQSAGIAAALAIDEGKTVQQVDYAKLAARLEKSGQVLNLPVIA